MGLQNVCDSLVEETDGLLACVVVDLDTGLTLATSCREGTESAAVGAATRRLGGLFRSKSLTLPNPKHAGGLVREAQVTFENTYHFMATIPGWSSALLVFVTDKAVSIGLGWMAVHQAYDRVLQARPGAAAPETEPEPRTPPPAARQDPPPSAARPDPQRGVGPAATSRIGDHPPRPAMPAAQTPWRHAPPPAPRRDAPPPVTKPPPLPVDSPDSAPPAVGRGGPRKSTESVPASGSAEPPTLATPEAREQRTGRQAPKVRPSAPSPISAAGKKPAPPPVEEDAKTEVGRMGARPVFGSKSRRS